MPRSGNALFPIISVLVLLPFGLFALGFGVLGIFADPEIWPLCSVLALGGLMMLAGMVQSLVRWRRAYRREEEEYAAMTAVVRARTADPAARLPRTVLAHWTYPWDHPETYPTYADTPASNVVISPAAILMNDQYQVIQDHHFRFSFARIEEYTRPKLLVIGIEWPTRYGRMSHEYRIPIPTDREDEAHKVAGALARKYGTLPPM